MDHSTFMQKIEDGEIGREDAIHECIPAYQSAWASIMSLRQIFDKIDEPGTSAALSEALDGLDSALGDHFLVDEDGVISVRTE